MKVLHYISDFLNYSETFIKRLIEHHRQCKPVAMGYRKKELGTACPTFIAPNTGWNGVMNTVYFHLNGCLPFYTDTIKKVQPNIIHAHFGFNGYRMIKPSQETGIPLVVSFHGFDVSRLPTEFDWKRRYRKLAAHGSAFTAVSELMKEDLINLGFPERKIKVVRCGLDLKKFPFSKSFSAAMPIMMVGRMVEKKGFIYALKAIKLLKDAGDAYRLDIFGDGLLEKELHEKACRWKIDHLVNFHGSQANNIIQRAYPNHSMLLAPSVTASDGDREGLPISILEAMACGTPVIATNHSAIPEIITHKKTGFLVEEADAKALAEMITIIKNKQAAVSKISIHARKQIEERFSIALMVQKIEHIYQDVLQNTPSPS